MCISGDETNVLGSRERNEVVVSLVRGPNRRRRFWVGDDMRNLPHQPDKLGGVCGLDPLSYLRVLERTLDLAEQRLAHEELERARKPQLDQPRRRARL